MTNATNGASKDRTYGLGALWYESRNFPVNTKLGMLLHHARQAWQSFLIMPLTSIITAITIATSLLVLAIFILFIENIRGVVASVRTDLAISIYLKDDISEKQIEDLEMHISKLDYVESVKLRSKDAALQEFKKDLGERALILEGLENNNPLPQSLEIKFKQKDDIEEYFRPFAESYSNYGGVDYVEYSRGLVERLNSFLRLFGWIAVISIIFMLLITSFIITNTIKLALYSHREEIEIMALVGATNNFVRAPYVIEGFCQGVLGAVLAIFLCNASYVLVQDLFSQNEILQILSPKMSFLSVGSMLTIVLSGIAVGVGASFFAVRKFLIRGIA